MRIRKSYLFAMAAVIAFSGYAQKKPKINQANAAREKGELAEAKSIIDEAIVFEKVKDDAKTWYYRGLIYATIDTTSNAEYAGLADNALEEAVAAFNKAHELDPDEKGLYTTAASGFPILMGQQIDDYYSFYFNKAANAFENKEYPVAVENFETASVIKPADTTAYVYAAYAAHNGELYDAAIKNYEAARKAGATSVDMIYNPLNILISAKEDKEGALALVNEGLEAYPTDKMLLQNRINLLIQLDMVEDAKKDLEKAIEAEPNNGDLLFTMGILLDESGDRAGAKEAYKKAISVAPDHFEANYNYGVLLIDEANDIIKEMNNLGMSAADQKKAKAMEPKIDEKLKEALPQWEKIYEIKPSETQVMETLAYIYNQLGMKEKYNEISSKLN